MFDSAVEDFHSNYRDTFGVSPLNLSVAMLPAERGEKLLDLFLELLRWIFRVFMMLTEYVQ